MDKTKIITMEMAVATAKARLNERREYVREIIKGLKNGVGVSGKALTKNAVSTQLVTYRHEMDSLNVIGALLAQIKADKILVTEEVITSFDKVVNTENTRVVYEIKAGDNFLELTAKYPNITRAKLNDKGFDIDFTTGKIIKL